MGGAQIKTKEQSNRSDRLADCMEYSKKDADAACGTLRVANTFPNVEKGPRFTGGRLSLGVHV